MEKAAAAAAAEVRRVRRWRCTATKCCRSCRGTACDFGVRIGGTDSAALRTSWTCLRLCGSCVAGCTSFFRGSDPATQEEKEGNRHPPHVRFPPTSQPRGCACVELRLRVASCCEPRFSTDLLLHVSRDCVCQCCDYVMFAAWRKTRSWLRMNTLACASLPWVAVVLQSCSSSFILFLLTAWCIRAVFS